MTTLEQAGPDLSSTTRAEADLDLTRWAFAAAVAIACGLAAYFQPFGVSRDFVQYDSFLDSVRGVALRDAILQTRFEPAFVVMAQALAAVTRDNLLILAVIAAAAGGMKMRLLSVAGGTALGTLVATALFLVRFVPLHELTQVRASVALVFLVAALTLRLRGQVRWAIVVALAAIGFHFSSVFIIPALFVRAQTRAHTLLLAVAAMVATALALELVIRVLGPSIAAIAMYQQVGFGENAVNPFSPSVALDVAMCVTGLVLWTQLSSRLRHLLTLQVIGLGIFVGALRYPVFAHRIREMFTLFWILYVALSFRRSRDLAAAAGIFTVLCMALYTYVYFFDASDVYFR